MFGYVLTLCVQGGRSGRKWNAGVKAQTSPFTECADYTVVCWRFRKFVTHGVDLPYLVFLWFLNARSVLLVYENMVGCTTADAYEEKCVLEPICHTIFCFLVADTQNFHLGFFHMDEFFVFCLNVYRT